MHDQLLEQIKPEQIIENRKVYSGENSELCLYETFQEAEMVNFGHLNNPVLLFMLSGKKVIHEDANSQNSIFNFMPGDSLVMAPQELVQIDFPNATPANPTQCLTLEIGCSIIRSTLNQLKEVVPGDEKTLLLDDDNLKYESIKDHRINSAIHRICSYYTNQFDQTSRKLLIDHTLQELVILMMQTKARKILMSKNGNDMPRLEFIIDYIMEHLQEDLSVDELAEKACMSKPTFHRYFKKFLGMSPVDFINTKRMQLAKQMLVQGNSAVSDVCYAVGFNNTSHFIRSFKKQYGYTPKQYQKHIFSN
jgi:AraC-like DNA-binding protein